MAGFNDLGRGKIGIGVEKLLGIASAGALRSLAPEVSTVLQIPISQEELQGVSGFGRWASGIKILAVAAQMPRFQIRNPAGSGIIVVIERVTVSQQTNASAWFADGGYAPSADLASVNLQDFRDGRTNPRGNGVAVVSSGTNAAAVTGTSGAISAQASETAEFPITPLILLPGNTYLFGAGQPNIEAYVNLVWRERGATPAEMAL